VGRDTTYGDYSRTGTQDCQNAFGVDDVDFELGDDEKKTIPERARLIMEANMRSFEENGSKEGWFEQNDVAGDDPHLDPEKAYQAWRSAWVSCATRMVQETLEESIQTAKDEHVAFYLYGDTDEEPIEVYDDEESALRELARLPTGKILKGDANGPEYEIWAVHPGVDAFYGTDVGRSCCLAMMDEFRMQRALARSRQWRANPRNPYEVRSPSGKEEEYADRDDAEFHADELRRAGVRDVQVVPRTRTRPGQRKNPSGMIWAAPGATAWRNVLDDLEVARDAFVSHDEKQGEIIVNEIVSGYPTLRIARCIRRLYDTNAAKKHPKEVQQYLYKIYGEGIRASHYFGGGNVGPSGPQHHMVVVSASRLVDPRGEVAIFRYQPDDPSTFGTFPLRDLSYNADGIPAAKFGTLAPLAMLEDVGIHYVIRCEEDMPARKRARKNPDQALTKEQATERFYELLQDPDPNSMEIAQDLVLEYGLSLVELGEKQAAELGARASKASVLNKKSWESSMGYFRLTPSFSVNMGPPRSVLWTIDATNRQRHYLYFWGDEREKFFPGSVTRTDAEARRIAAADCWVIAKALKGIASSASWSEVKSVVAEAYSTSPSTEAMLPELYGGKQRTPTFAEARKDLFEALRERGWQVSAQLKTPWAEAPNRRMRLWFKPQAVWASFDDRGRHTLGGASSITGGALMPEIRSLSGAQYVQRLYSIYPEELRR
jgi:hypothetical protein